MTFESPADNARYLLIRLCLRKIEKWHRLSTLRYEQELGSGIPAAIQELCRDTPPELPSTEEQRPVVKEEEQPVVKEEEREIIDLTLDSPSHSQLAQLSRLSASAISEPDYSYFADDDSQATLQELIDCLTLDELRGIAKQMKLKITANVSPVSQIT